MDECIRFATCKRTNRQDNSKRMMHYVKKMMIIAVIFSRRQQFHHFQEGAELASRARFYWIPIPFQSAETQEWKVAPLGDAELLSWEERTRRAFHMNAQFDSPTFLGSRIPLQKQIHLCHGSLFYWNVKCRWFFQKKLGIFVMFGGCKAWSGLTMEI